MKAMAASGRKGQSDITLGGGHVAGIFLGVVVLCGIFFTLGYVMGHNRNALLPAPAGTKNPAVDSGGDLTASKGTPASTGWDFYPKKSPSGKSAVPTPGLTPETSGKPHPEPVDTTAAPPAPSGPIAMESKPAHVAIDHKPPALPGGREGISLQVAALRNRGDALALAGFLKKKGYPAFAWGPGGDRLFRVQVGPYGTAKTAEAAKKKLEREGFKSILKK
jgi:DedD protein